MATATKVKETVEAPSIEVAPVPPMAEPPIVYGKLIRPTDGPAGKEPEFVSVKNLTDIDIEKRHMNLAKKDVIYTFPAGQTVRVPSYVANYWLGDFREENHTDDAIWNTKERKRLMAIWHVQINPPRKNKRGETVYNQVTSRPETEKITWEEFKKHLTLTRV